MENGVWVPLKTKNRTVIHEQNLRDFGMWIWLLERTRKGILNACTYQPRSYDQQPHPSSLDFCTYTVALHRPMMLKVPCTQPSLIPPLRFPMFVSSKGIQLFYQQLLSESEIVPKRKSLFSQFLREKCFCFWNSILDTDLPQEARTLYWYPKGLKGCAGTHLTLLLTGASQAWTF